MINFYYEEGDAGQFDPTVRDIQIENLHCKNVLSKAFYLNGFERAPINDIHFKNCHFDQVGSQSIVAHVNNMSLDNVTLNKQPLTMAQLQQS